MYINKVILAGNLVRDPEVKALPSGTQVTNFAIATNRVWFTEGVKNEATDYHNIVTFGKTAENVGRYLTKGTNVLVEGRLQTRSWETKEGTKKYVTEVIADNVQFGARPADAPQAPAKAAPAKAEPTIEYPAEDINPDDIPF